MLENCRFFYHPINHTWFWLGFLWGCFLVGWVFLLLLVIPQGVDLPSTQEVWDHKYKLAAVFIMSMEVFSFKRCRVFVPIAVRNLFSFYKPTLEHCKYCYFERKHLHF